MLNQCEDFQYAPFSASGALKTGPGQLGGIFVSSVSGSPTITIYDSIAGSGSVIVAQFVPVAGVPYPFPCRFSTGLYVVIGGTVNATAFFN